MFNFDFNHRRSIRLPGYDYASAGAYFVTVCAYRKEMLFGEIQNGEMNLNATGKIIMECWNFIRDHFQNVEIDEFVVMPNHIHGIVWISDPIVSGRGTIYRASTMERFSRPVIGSIPTVVRTFKAAVTRHINASNPLFGPVWQRNYYERIIRNEAELYAVRQYIRDNPLKWDEDPERK